MINNHSEEKHCPLMIKVEKALNQTRWANVTVVLFHPYNYDDIVRVIEMEQVVSVVINADSCWIPARDYCRFGVYYPEKPEWVLPNTISSRIILVDNASLSARMAIQAILKGVREVFFCEKGGDERITNYISRTIWQRIIKNSISRSVRKKLFTGSELKDRSSDDDTDAILKPDMFDANKVLMINSALAWGGAERQLVNTMIGLNSRDWKVDLLCEALNYVPDSDFFEWRLEERGLKAEQIRQDSAQFSEVLTEDQILAVKQRAAKLSPPLRDSIVPYALEILARKPGVVHAWQDQTCIKAGLAAVIAGVPKIVLATRNVSPVNFAYYQDYMPEAYKILIKHPNVRIINNSKAGVQDYCKWLECKSDKFDLVYNGIEFEDMRTPTKEESAAFRKKLGISSNTVLLGGMFRLYEEKDPFLWLETAVEVAKKLPELEFIIFGVGPLKEKLLEHMVNVGMAGTPAPSGNRKKSKSCNVNYGYILINFKI